MVRKILRIVVCLCVLFGGSMATTIDYSQYGIRSMDDARGFKTLTLARPSISDGYIRETIANTISNFRTLNREDQAVAVLWKLDTLCGHAFSTLRADATYEITRLVNTLIPESTTDTRSFDVRYANVLWNSQYIKINGGGTLKSVIDVCVISKIGQLLSRRTEEAATRLKEEIVSILTQYGYHLNLYFS